MGCNLPGIQDTEGQKKYLDFLRDWLKDREYVALAYMTGILPIKKYGKHSALNMFDEYSMTQPMRLAEYVGFTSEEVKELCRERKLNYDGLKNWYDGYRLSFKVSSVPSQSFSALKSPSCRQLLRCRRSAYPGTPSRLRLVSDDNLAILIVKMIETVH